MRGARGARLSFLIRPIKFLSCGLVDAVDVVETFGSRTSDKGHATVLNTCNSVFSIACRRKTIHRTGRVIHKGLDQLTTRGSEETSGRDKCGLWRATRILDKLGKYLQILQSY